MPGVRRCNREDQDGVDDEFHLPQLPAARVAIRNKCACFKPHRVGLQSSLEWICPF